MKIAFSSSGFSEFSLLSPSLGECPTFLIYDMDTLQYETVENIYRNSDKSKGPKAVMMLVERGIDAIVTYHIGRNAFNEAKLSGLKVYLSPELGMIKDVLKQYQHKNLPLIEDFEGDVN